MKRYAFLALAFVVTTCGAAVAAIPPEFVSKPAATADDKNMVIKFTVNQATDATVTVLDKDGKVVRHLASGKLGPNAPAPLKTGLLEQAVVWDGNDDAGRPLAAGEYKARVALGMTPKFDRVLGEEKQFINTVDALAVGPKGEVYVLDGGSIVVLDRDGGYVRQVAPRPADMDLAKLAGLEPVTLADGTTYFRRSYPATKGKVGSMAVTPDGKYLLLPGAPRYPRKLTRIGTDGSVPAGAFDTRLTTHADNGFLYLACSPDGKTLYMGGAEAGYEGDDARKVSYRQSVYRLKLDSSGPAETFTGDDENSARPGFSVDTPKGLATDPAGRLYVCNYGENNVAVYTPGAGFIKAFDVSHPQQVAVNPKTGQVYVLTGSETARSDQGFDYPAVMHDAKLVRLNGDGRVEKELVLDPPFIKTRKDKKTGQPVAKPEFHVRMAVDFSDAARPIVWVGVASPSTPNAKWGLYRIEDTGEFGEPRDVIVKGPSTLQGNSARMALDREKDILYLAAGGAKLARYAGDGTLMAPLRLTDERGEPAKVAVAEPAVGPNGMIYFTAWDGAKYRDTFVCRATAEGRLAPFGPAQTRPEAAPTTQPRAGSAGWPALEHAFKGGSGDSARGFAVGRNGEMYLMYFDDSDRPADKAPPELWDKCLPLPTAVAKFSADGKLVNRHLIYYLRSGAQCVRADSKGNLYVGDNFMPAGVAYPGDFVKAMDDPLRRPYPARLADASFDPLLQYMGCVVKFGPAGGRIVGLPEDKTYPAAERPQSGDLYQPPPEVQWFMFNSHNLQVAGALWQFHGLSPMPAQYQGVTHVERCVCRAARFDIDPFDRVFVPDVLRGRISVLDSAGNVICRFGQYGNLDTPKDKLPMQYAWSVAAADDHAYVGDSAARRVTRVKFAYAAEATCDVKK